MSYCCVNWSDVRKRCQSWVDQKMPYSQQRTHDGYRMDCSGMASWCIYGGTGAHKPGLTTRTFPSYGKYITKNELRPGHLMLNSGSHVALFAGWADSSHSQYYSYEESQSKGNAIYRTVPYPYWSSAGGSAYKPFKTTDVTIC